MPSLVQLEVEDFKSWVGKNIIGPFKQFTCISASDATNVMDALCFGIGEMNLPREPKKLIHGANVYDPVSDKARVTVVISTGEGKELRFCRTVSDDDSIGYEINNEPVTEAQYRERQRQILKMDGIGNYAEHYLKEDVKVIASKNPKEREALFLDVLQSGVKHDQYERLKRNMLETKDLAQTCDNDHVTVLRSKQRLSHKLTQNQTYMKWMSNDLKLWTLKLMPLQLYKYCMYIDTLTKCQVEVEEISVPASPSTMLQQNNEKVLKEKREWLLEAKEVELHTRAARHKLLLDCKDKKVDLPLNSGSLDDVKSTVSNKDYSSEDELSIDFSRLPDYITIEEYIKKKVDDYTQGNLELSLFELYLHQKNIDKLREKISELETEIKAQREKANTASNERLVKELKLSSRHLQEKLYYRHKLLLDCKDKNVDIPLKSGSLDDVKSTVSNKDYPAEDKLSIDFSRLPDSIPKNEELKKMSNDLKQRFFAIMLLRLYHNQIAIETIQKKRAELEAMPKGTPEDEKAKASLLEDSLKKELHARHKLLLDCKDKKVNLPLNSGSLDDVKSTVSNEDYPAEDKLSIDFSVLPDYITMDEKAIAAKNCKDHTITNKLAYFRQLKASTEEALKLITSSNAKTAIKLASVAVRCRYSLEVFQERKEDAISADSAFRDIYHQFLDGVNGLTQQFYKNLCKKENALAGVNPDDEGLHYWYHNPGLKWNEMGSEREKTMASLALIFALHHFRPALLYVLHNVDNALDDTDIGKVADFLSVRSNSNSQIFVISRKGNSYSDALLEVHPDLRGNTDQLEGLRRSCSLLALDKKEQQGADREQLRKDISNQERELQKLRGNTDQLEGLRRSCSLLALDKKEQQGADREQLRKDISNQERELQKILATKRYWQSATGQRDALPSRKQVTKRYWHSATGQQDALPSRTQPTKRCWQSATGQQDALPSLQKQYKVEEFIPLDGEQIDEPKEKPEVRRK